MFNIALLPLLLGGLPVLESNDFPAELQRTALAATVRITSPKGLDGTGVVVGTEAPWVYILTAGHVVQGAKEVDAALFTAQSYPEPSQVFKEVRVVAQSQGVKDLALLRVPTTEKLVPIRFHPRPAELNSKNFAALTVGCSRGAAPTCEIARIESAGLRRRETKGEQGKLWEARSAQTFGRSGGPLLDSKGRLIGIASGNNLGHAYFVHLEEVQTFLRRHQFEFVFDDNKAAP